MTVRNFEIGRHIRDDGVRRGEAAIFADQLNQARKLLRWCFASLAEKCGIGSSISKPKVALKPLKLSP
jgi:hypothetical protein